MKSGIYKITCGSKWYFGQAQDLSRREKTHLSTLQRQCHRNPILQNTYNKYGDFKFEVIWECSVEELNHYEQMILDVWHGEPECMNICKDVGHSTRGRKASDETKAKLSIIASNRSEETRNKMSTAQQNRPPISEETRKKLSETSKGRIESLETKSKKSERMKGNQFSKGRSKSASAGKPSIPVELDGIMYPSLSEAARQLGIDRQTLTYRLRKMQKSS